MENLDQIQLLYINLALLMFTSSIAIYLPRKMHAAQNPKPKFHPEFVQFYKILNQSLKVFQPKLTYIVDKMPAHEFVAFYKGLQYLGFKLELHSHRLDNGVYSEYIVLDLASYSGPRTVELIMLDEPKVAPPSAAQLYQEVLRQPNFKSSQKSFGNVVSLLNRRKKVEAHDDPAHKVVDLNSYRQRRVINYIPDGNEGA